MSLGNPLKTPNLKEGSLGKVRTLFDALWRVTEATQSDISELHIAAQTIGINKVDNQHTEPRPLPRVGFDTSS